MEQTPRFPSLFYHQRLNAAGLFFLCGVLLYLLFLELSFFLSIPLMLAFFLGAILKSGEGRKTFLCFALGLSLSLISISLCEIRQEKARALCGKEGIAEGYVLQTGEETFDLSLVSFQDEPCFFRVRCQGEMPEQGDKIALNLEITNAYSKDIRSDSIALAAKAEEGFDLCGKSNLFSFVGTVRQKILKSFGEGETGSFLSAILLGEREGLSTETKSAFRITASSHILAISGLHVSQLLGFLFCFSRVFSLNIRFTRAMLYPVSLILFFMAGAGVSVFRALVMTLFATTGILLRRRSSSVTALVFSAVLLVFPDPFALENMSFLFSYFSTFALITCGAPLSDSLGKRLFSVGRKTLFRKGILALCTSFSIASSVFVFMLPLQLLFFGEVQAFSPLYALILVPLFQPVLVVALLLAILSFLPEMFALFSPFLVPVPTLYLTLVKLLSSASPPLISLGSFATPAAIFIGVVLLVFFLRKEQLSRLFYLHLFFFVILCLCSFFVG